MFFNKFDFLAPWLVIAYVLFISAVILGAGIQGPWTEKLGKAAAQSPVSPPSAKFVAVASDARAKGAQYGAAVIIVLIIIDMVLKPFSTPF